MSFIRPRAALFIGILAAISVPPPAAAQHLGRFTLNPKSYRSPSGEYELRVDPGMVYGQELWMLAEDARKVERIEVPASDLRSPTDTQPAQTQPAAEGHAGQAPPIVYSPRYERLEQPPLSGEQVAKIVRLSAERKPEGQGIWFIYALANGRRESVVEVYFAPSALAPRLRKGTFVRMRMSSSPEEAESKNLPVTIAASMWGPGLGPSREYWQVSKRDEPFGDIWEVPTPPLLPFARPEGFTEDEVVALVDFVRSSPKLPATLPNRIVVLDRIDGSLPILSIKRDGDVITVGTGTHEGPLCGAGEFLRIRKSEDGTFELLEIGMWAS